MNWEYCTFAGLDKDGDEEVSLDLLGSDGWELVSVVWDHRRGLLRYFFKRPLPEKQGTPQ